MTPRLNHDEYFLKMLELVTGRSTCRRRAVGAIIVDKRHRVLSTGYNGVPRGFQHCIDTPCAGAQDPSGDSSRCAAVHAEINALINCTRLDLAWKLYVSCTPCFTCAKALANTNIKHVIVLEEYPDVLGPCILQSAGITLRVR